MDRDDDEEKEVKKPFLGPNFQVSMMGDTGEEAELKIKPSAIKESISES
jgi:hypothetical protein